jgi:hypothetical protein
MREQNGQDRKGKMEEEKKKKIYLSENGEILEDMIDTALVDCLKEGKTLYAEPIAYKLISKKDNLEKAIIPPKIQELFQKISADLHLINL